MLGSLSSRGLLPVGNTLTSVWECHPAFNRQVRVTSSDCRKQTTCGSGCGSGKVDLHAVMARCLGNTPGLIFLRCNISLHLHGRLLKRDIGDCRTFPCSISQATPSLQKKKKVGALLRMRTSTNLCRRDAALLEEKS